MEVQAAAAAGDGAAAERSASPAPAQMAAPVTAPLARTLSRQDSASAAGSFGAWVVQKLKAEWSSDELGGLLTRERITDALSSFPQLENPTKARLLLALLSMRADEADACRGAIKELLALGESDAEEWVRISAGAVAQFQLMDANGTPSDSFFHTQLAKTADAIVHAVAGPSGARERTLDDFLSLENALLNPSIRAEIALKPAKHFTVLAPPPDAIGKGGDRDERHPKKPLHRPQMARPLLHQSSSAAASTRTTLTSTKPPAPKKKVADVTSEIRRKADAGRFKRQRSRISMIDIDEVKQIESEKAQKAEERKKQKLLAKEKEKAAAAGAAATGPATVAANSNNVGEEASPPSTSAGANIARDDSGNTDASAGADAVYEEHSDQQEHDTVSEDEQSGSAEPSSHTDASYEPDARSGLYAADGARALLSAAAFHSSQDAVVPQETRPLLHQQQAAQLPPYQPVYQQQQQQPQPLPPPPQFQQRGFEPEDAGTHMGFGGYDFGSHAAVSNGSASAFYGDQLGSYRPAQEASAYNSAYLGNPQQAQVPGNAAAHGFYPLPDQRGVFDQRQQQLEQQQQQQQQQQQPRQPHGGYLDGPPEYWR